MICLMICLHDPPIPVTCSQTGHGCPKHCTFRQQIHWYLPWAEGICPGRLPGQIPGLPQGWLNDQGRTRGCTRANPRGNAGGKPPGFALGKPHLPWCTPWGKRFRVPTGFALVYALGNPGFPHFWNSAYFAHSAYSCGLWYFVVCNVHFL